jgi:hypothetical protein
MGHFKGQIYTFLKKMPPMGISSQTTPLNNFSAVQPISTKKTPVDPVQQM